MNNIIESYIQCKVDTYKSIDTVLETDEAVNYPTQVLNSFDLPGMLSHELQSKFVEYHAAKYPPATIIFQQLTACSKKNYIRERERKRNVLRKNIF